MVAMKCQKVKPMNFVPRLIIHQLHTDNRAIPHSDSYSVQLTTQSYKGSPFIKDRKNLTSEALMQKPLQ